jgi:hypothetical protein
LHIGGVVVFGFLSGRSGLRISTLVGLVIAVSMADWVNHKGLVLHHFPSGGDIRTLGVSADTAAHFPKWNADPEIVPSLSPYWFLLSEINPTRLRSNVTNDCHAARPPTQTEASPSAIINFCPGFG